MPVLAVIPWLLGKFGVFKLTGLIAPWFTSSFFKIKTMIVPLLVLAVIILGGLVFFQLDKLRISAEKNEKLQQDIRDLKLSVALTEKLQTDNANLKEDLDDLRDLLADAPSSSLPLPDDIRRIVNGLR